MVIENFAYRMLATEWARVSVQEATKGRLKASKISEQIVRLYDCMSVACADASDNAQWESEIDNYKAAFLVAEGGAL